MGAVSHQVSPEVATDGARLGLRRVGRAQHGANLVDGPRAFVQQGQALCSAGAGLLLRVCHVLGVDTGHVLDDLVEFGNRVAAGEVGGQHVGVGVGELEIERIVEILPDSPADEELELGHEDVLQRPVELLALGDGHVEKLGPDDPQAGEAEGVDDVARAARSLVEVVGLEHHQRYFRLAVVLDPPGQHAAVAIGVLGQQPQMLVVEFGVRACNDGRLEVTHRSVLVAEEVSVCASHRIADRLVGELAYHLFLEVAHGVLAAKEHQHAARRVAPAVGRAEIRVQVLAPCLGDGRIAAFRADDLRVLVDELVGEHEHPRGHEIELCVSQQTPDDPAGAALVKAVRRDKCVGQFFTHW